MLLLLLFTQLLYWYDTFKYGKLNEFNCFDDIDIGIGIVSLNDIWLQCGRFIPLISSTILQNNLTKKKTNIYIYACWLVYLQFTSQFVIIFII